MATAKPASFLNGLSVIGVDEVGRGCLAGPVVAGAHLFHPGMVAPLGLKDSKKLSPKQRQGLLAPLLLVGTHGLGEATHDEIDALNIKNATFLAMRRALEALAIPHESRSNYAVLVDGNVVPDFSDMGWGSVTCLIKADDLIPEVSAASVVAKEYRDELMVVANERFPGYDFAANSGYGSPTHMEALSTLGYVELHRKSFQPIKGMVAAEVADRRPKLR